MKVAKHEGKSYKLLPIEQPMVVLTLEGFEVLKGEKGAEITIEENISPEVGLEELEMILLSGLISTVAKEFIKMSDKERKEKSDWMVSRVIHALAEAEVGMEESRREDLLIN